MQKIVFVKKKSQASQKSRRIHGTRTFENFLFQSDLRQLTIGQRDSQRHVFD
jgi:hypothetical protein